MDKKQHPGSRTALSVPWIGCPQGRKATCLTDVNKSSKQTWRAETTERTREQRDATGSLLSLVNNVRTKKKGSDNKRKAKTKNQKTHGEEKQTAQLLRVTRSMHLCVPLFTKHASHVLQTKKGRRSSIGRTPRRTARSNESKRLLAVEVIVSGATAAKSAIKAVKDFAVGFVVDELANGAVVAAHALLTVTAVLSNWLRGQDIDNEGCRQPLLRLLLLSLRFGFGCGAAARSARRRERQR